MGVSNAVPSVIAECRPLVAELAGCPTILYGLGVRILLLWFKKQKL